MGIPMQAACVKINSANRKKKGLEYYISWPASLIAAACSGNVSRLWPIDSCLEHTLRYRK